MNELATVQIVALLGWLVVAMFAFASFRLNWMQSARMALIWIAIFGGVALLFSLIAG